MAYIMKFFSLKWIASTAFVAKETKEMGLLILI